MKKKQCWFRWYIIDPVINWVYSIGAWFVDLLWDPIVEWNNRRLGKWYCQYCNKDHTARIYAFQLKYRTSLAHERWAAAPATDQSHRMCCSKGLDALIAKTWEPEEITVLAENLHEAVSKAGASFTSLLAEVRAVNNSSMIELGYGSLIEYGR